ncbi:MAG: hypothetical protein EZS28_049000 [Streblomastix strix]|uniref:SPRY domain-containing protein n=1 Tax=Streblomastix strix TaxID=222440 RepID=A0A5J4TCG6_9EUKA|nr:MAG: hypothetical protein EZS28_049000 [Streblomastix strix]
MTVPQEYNVDGGLLGFGQDIYLDLLTEINELSDVQQFIGVDKKKFPLQNHPRFHKSIENALYELDNPDQTCKGVRLELANGLLRKAVALQDNKPCSVSLNKVLRDIIHKIEVRFDKCNSLFGYMNGVVGILKANYQIPYPCAPGGYPHNKNMLNYDGSIGGVFFKGNGTLGNVQFKDGQLIAMKLNADVGTLHFFVDGIQQPVFVSGINEAVKFYV